MPGARGGVDYVGWLKEGKTPLVLIVTGRADLVVQEAETYQLLLERLERAETVGAKHGTEVHITDEAFADLDVITGYLKSQAIPMLLENGLLR